MKSIFLDTNIFLHFTSFDEIQWLKESDSTECEIVLSPFVIDELDKKKVGTKVSNRARAALQKVEKLIETNKLEVQKGVLINILNHKPTKGFYEEYELNYDEPDQRILASIIDYRLKNPSTTTVLCSDDIGPRLRAKNFQIDSLKLSDSYRLSSEESENEKKIQKLEQENLLLKKKIPKLKLEFDGGYEYKKIEIKKSGYSYPNF
jgi:predicted ribonuclease YlaK